MLVLLDESLPRAFIPVIPGHEVRTVQQMGWAGVANGELLRRTAQAGFSALVTADRNLEHQNEVATAGVAVVVLVAPTNRFQDLALLAPRGLQLLRELQPGQVARVER